MSALGLRRLSRTIITTRTRRTASSFVRGSTEEPLLEQTFPEFFAQKLLPRYSSSTALISTHEHPRAHGGPLLASRSDASYLTWTFEDLDRHVAALSRGLLKLGVKKGDRVGVVMGNNRYCLVSIDRVYDAFVCAVLIVTLEIFQCICYSPVGMRKDRSHPRHDQSCVQDVRDGEFISLPVQASVLLCSLY